MSHLQVFTDVSVNTKLKVGYGAYLIVSDPEQCIDTFKQSSFKQSLQIKRFEQTSSTKLELQTLLWALDDTIDLFGIEDLVLTIFTDSQNIIGLPGRRKYLEQNDYFSKQDKRLNNYQLYQQFYLLTSRIACNFIKVVGHQNAEKKDQLDRLFSLVDKASRKALRDEFNV